MAMTVNCMLSHPIIHIFNNVARLDIYMVIHSGFANHTCIFTEKDMSLGTSTSKLSISFPN